MSDLETTDIYSYVKAEEANFETGEIRVGSNWTWSFKNHTQLIFHLKNGQFFTGENNWLRAFKNIMEPMLNLSYWSEQIEVKDVVFDIEEDGGRAMGFILKKYHDEVFTKVNNLDEVFDDITESDLDYGGVLVQETDGVNPEVLELTKVAFCDQTDIEGGPIAFRHDFSPDKLRAMASKGWGKESNGANITLEDLITLAQPEKNLVGMQGQKNKTPGKNIEVYVLRGNLPQDYLKDDGNFDNWYNQVHILAFYYSKKDKREGCTLYRKKETEGALKFFTSKKVSGRALGRGEGEAQLHPQIWTNFLTIHKMNLIESAAKVPLVTDDPMYTQKQKIQDMENLEITTIEEGKKIWQVPTAAPANISVFEQAINDWYAQAQLLGSASDTMLGEKPSSGTTFRGQNQVLQQGRGMHDKRRGKRAKFIQRLYREIWIPKMIKEIGNGKKFLATLTWEEMGWVSGNLAESYANKMVIDDVLNGRPVRDRDQLKQECIQQFMTKGNKHLFEIIKDEFKDVDIKLSINVSNKQKDLIGMVDNLRSVFQTIAANPYILKAPPMEKLFNRIVEASGLEPIDLTGLNIPHIPQMRLTEKIDFKDMPPEAQKQMLSIAGYGATPQPTAGPQPANQ